MSHRTRRPCVALLGVLLLAPIALPRSYAAALAQSGAAALNPPDELSRLAEGGQFERVAASLRSFPDSQNNPSVASLLRQIDDYQRHRADQDAKRREAFGKAADKMSAQLDAGRLEGALLSAVEAHGLADDPEAFLRDARVASLVQKAEANVKESEAAGDWVEALAVVRTLDVLFEDHGTYRDEVKDATRHVRVLRLYAPEELERLLQQRADRLAKAQAEEPAAAGDPDAPEKKKPDPVRLDKEPWQRKLRGVDLPMVMESLRTAAQKHVSTRGYTTLLTGAVEGFEVFLDTKALRNTFASVGDGGKVAQFRSALGEARRAIDAQAPVLNAADKSDRDRAANAAAAIIDRLMDANARTLELPKEVVAFEIAEGALDNLDEFSAVIWPHERDAFTRNFKGDFYGVGIQIGQKFDPKLGRDRLLVVSPLEGTPAQRAGIRAEDIIATVNGRETLDWSLDQAVREITGPEGTAVVLGVERPGVPEPLEFKLTRAKIPIESIRGWEHREGGGWNYFIDREAGIGYVRLSQFIPQTADDLDAAINQMDKEGGVNALILDLRFNPGGLLTSAVDVSNRFIRNGLIVSTDGPPDTRKSTFKADPSHTHRLFPVVLLVNQGSASASEIVSGALQDYQRGLIVGTRSFGKGSVQDVFPIENGRAYLKLTTQYYKLPQGRIIHRQPDSRTWGIEPDLKVVMTSKQVVDAIEFRQKVDVLQDPGVKPDPAKPQPAAREILEKAMDPQLTSALLVLKTRLIADHLGPGPHREAAAR